MDQILHDWTLMQIQVIHCEQKLPPGTIRSQPDKKVINETIEPPPVCPLHLVCSWYLRALPRNPPPLYRLFIGVRFSDSSPLERSVDGPRWAACLRQSAQSAILYGTFGDRVRSFPPCLRIRLNELIGGGDSHRYSTLPSFSSSISACMPPRRPGFALEQKEIVTAWWLAAARRL